MGRGVHSLKLTYIKCPCIHSNILCLVGHIQLVTYRCTDAPFMEWFAKIQNI